MLEKHNLRTEKNLHKRSIFFMFNYALSKIPSPTYITDYAISSAAELAYAPFNSLYIVTG